MEGILTISRPHNEGHVSRILAAKFGVLSEQLEADMFVGSMVSTGRVLMFLNFITSEGKLRHLPSGAALPLKEVRKALEDAGILVFPSFTAIDEQGRLRQISPEMN